MARAAPFTMRYVVAVCCASCAAAALLAMNVLPSSCARSAALKSARGRPRSSLATRASAVTGDLAPAPSRRRDAGPGVSSAWMARSSCSLRFGLSIACTRPILFLRCLTYCFAGRSCAGNFCGFLAQSLDTAELQLFYGAFGASQGLRDFPDAFFFGEAHLHDLPLLDGKLLHQAE